MSNSESPDVRLKRLHMRSIRRGIKEMDLILTKFSELQLQSLSLDELDVYEALLNENDQDLLGWITGQLPPNEKYKQLILKIESTALQP